MLCAISTVLILSNAACLVLSQSSSWSKDTKLKAEKLMDLDSVFEMAVRDTQEFGLMRMMRLHLPSSYVLRRRNSFVETTSSLKAHLFVKPWLFMATTPWPTRMRSAMLTICLTS
jgi:hypothetical protein